MVRTGWRRGKGVAGTGCPLNVRHATEPGPRREPLAAGPGVRGARAAMVYTLPTSTRETRQAHERHLRTPASPRRRGIYLLPNLFTTGAMFSGFYAIIAGIGGHFSAAAIAVFIAALLDSMDGRVARLTGTQSDFGVQYDSLSDLVSFGLAPALVMYTWSLSSLRDYGPAWGKIGWAAAFIYAACGALRLARFNTQAGVADKRYFQGLASPAAAGLCMSFVWSMHKDGFSGAGTGVRHAAAGGGGRTADGQPGALLQLQGLAPARPGAVPVDHRRRC